MKEIYQLTIAQLNNRETAIGIWLLCIFLLCLMSKKLREPVWEVLKAIFDLRLVVFFGSVGALVIAICLALKNVGLWGSDQSAATFLWFAFSGTITAGKALQVQEDEEFFKKLFWDSIKVAGAFEFIVVAHSFSLFAELLLAPILAMLGMFQAIADTKEEYAPVKKLVNVLLFGVVILFLWNSAAEIINNPDAFFTSQTGRNFLLPAFLTIGCIPIFYFWYCNSHIQSARIQIDQKTFQSEELKKYARKRFFLTFMARPWLLKRATRQFHILAAKENSDVDAIVQSVLTYEREAENPPCVDLSKGWSPYLAREFLSDQGLRTDDYHQGFDNEYWAGAGYIDLDESIFPNNATLYIEGEAGLVRRIKLTGKFLDEFATGEALERLRVLAGILFERAVGHHDLNFEEVMPQGSPFEFKFESEGTKVHVYSARYPNDKGHEVFFILSR